MSGLLREANQVIRGLLRSPGFTLVAVLIMALGIGANTAIFSVVESVILRPLPYREAASVVMLWSGAHLSSGEDSEASSSRVVSAGYFETAAVPLLRGRFFASTDGPQAQPVAIINQAMAKRLWPGEDPIGRRFRYGVPGETPALWRTVVGIVGDTLPDGPESRVYPEFFLPQSQIPWTSSMDMVIRVANNQLPLASSIRAAILAVSPEIPRFEVTLTGAGLLLGLAGALALSHAASSLLFGVAWTDSLTVALAALLLLTVALAAGYIPARRATRVDPAIALSTE